MTDLSSTSFYADANTDLRGPKGEKGDKGNQGDAGPPGVGSPGLPGSDGQDGSDGVNAPYKYGGFAVSAILASEILMDHVVVEDHTLRGNLEGSRISCGANPAANFVCQLSKNGVAIGTMQLSTGGVATLTTAGGDPVTVIVGDIITLTAPPSPDASIGRLRFTLFADLGSGPGGDGDMPGGGIG